MLNRYSFWKYNKAVWESINDNCECVPLEWVTGWCPIFAFLNSFQYFCCTSCNRRIIIEVFYVQDLYLIAEAGESPLHLLTPIKSKEFLNLWLHMLFWFSDNSSGNNVMKEDHTIDAPNALPKATAVSMRDNLFKYGIFRKYLVFTLLCLILYSSSDNVLSRPVIF